jgi:putative transposase
MSDLTTPSPEQEGGGRSVDEALAQELVERARSEGVELVGPGGLLTEVGEVEIDVPRDREGSFDPKIVAKRQRRLAGVDELVRSLAAKGLTTWEIAAHLADVYGAEVSRDTIARITDAVIEELAGWQSRPLDSVYPVVFIDAIHVKLRDGKVANRP